jgi:hypothetical protein
MLSNKRSRLLHSPKQLQKKRKKNIMLASSIFIGTIGTLILIIFILRFNFIQISSVQIIGANTLSAYEIEQKVLSILDDNYLYFIPKSNFIFYSKNLIKQELKASYKKIDSIEIGLNGISELGITIKEKDPNILVCEGFHEENVLDENCFFADKNGYIYEKAPQFSNGVYIRYYIDSEIGDKIIGTIFLDKKLFDDLQNFIDITKRSNINLIGILISTDGNYEMYYKNSDSTETVIYFNDRTPFEKTASNLVAFIDNLKIKKKSATTTPILDSINLRFGNNIFYVNK